MSRRTVTPPWTRPVAVLAATGLVMLGAAACTGGDEPPEGAPPTMPSGSPPATAAPGTGGGSDAKSVSDIEDATDLAAVMTGAMREARSARLTLTVAAGAGADELAGQGAIRVGDDPALQLASSAGGQQVKLRIVDGAVYLSPGRQIMGKSWIRLDPEGQDAVSGSVAGLVSALQGTLDVDRSVAGFDRADRFRKTGRKKLDGVNTLGFEVVLTGEALRGSLAEQFAGATGADLAGAEATYRINLDDAGRPKRVVVDTTSSAGTSKLTVDYSDWGAPVTINPPPPDQVR